MILLVISEALNPGMCRVASLLHLDMGIPLPRAGFAIIPADCAPRLGCMETAASMLSTILPAPEDTAASEALREGEAVRYLDCELATFVLGEPVVALSIARRIPGGAALYHGVEMMREQLSRRFKVGA